MKKRCFTCGEPVRGRSDKKFCSDFCRSTHHNRIYAQEERKLRYVNGILRQNRRLLIACREEKKSLNRQDMLIRGFKPEYCTGYIKQTNGLQRYLCYDLVYWFEPSDGTIRIQNLQQPAFRN